MSSQLGPDGLQNLKYELLQPYKRKNMALGLGLLGFVSAVCMLLLSKMQSDSVLN
jgi:hypothetical protein